MPDAKITALTAISVIDVAADVLPIVDISDTSMAASGTTKKITINQILGASGTATLASATIIGNLTVDTNTLFVDSVNNRVIIGHTSGASPFQVSNAGGAGFEVQPTGVNSAPAILSYNRSGAAWIQLTYGASSHVFQLSGTDGMTLNATGLGVGYTPSGSADKIGSAATLGVVATGATADLNFRNSSLTAIQRIRYTDGTGVLTIGSATGTAYPVELGGSTSARSMTLDASGNLLVGSALPVSGGRISGNSSSGPAGRFFSSAGDNQFAAMFDKSSATNTTSQWLIGFTINNQSTGSGQINANGASQAAFGTFSDSRLKENILSLPSQLANILSLRPVEFDYKDGSGHQIGFVAQEMQEVYSDAVGEQNGFLTVTGWSKTEARLVSAIKELAAKVQALEAKLA